MITTPRCVLPLLIISAMLATDVVPSADAQERFWICRRCHKSYRGKEPPSSCPNCEHNARFDAKYEFPTKTVLTIGGAVTGLLLLGGIIKFAMAGGFRMRRRRKKKKRRRAPAREDDDNLSS